VVVVDGLDFVLAAASNPGTALAMKEMLMELREVSFSRRFHRISSGQRLNSPQKTHAAIVTLAADDPLIKEHETTLEKQHAWFALSLAHEADTVFSLRLLDTGAAKDVSGVVRITHGGARTENHEYLYHVGGDGGVRVFERGQ
jgi:elongator complex protein 6